MWMRWYAWDHERRAAYIAGYLHGGSYPRIDDSPVGAYFRAVTAAAYEDWVARRGFWAEERREMVRRNPEEVERG